MTTTEPQGTVDLGQFSQEQLLQYKQHFEQQMQHLQNSIMQLKSVNSQYGESKECINQLTPENEGTPLLIPITSSLYVPAKLGDSSKVLIDIGTGYYAEKSTEDAKSFIERKTKLISENISKVQGALNNTRKQYGMVMQQIQIKQMQSQQ